MKLIAIQPCVPLPAGASADAPRQAKGPGLLWCGEEGDVGAIRSVQAGAVVKAIGDAPPEMRGGRVCYVETWGYAIKRLLGLE